MCLWIVARKEYISASTYIKYIISARFKAENRKLEEIPYIYILQQISLAFIHFIVSIFIFFYTKNLDASFSISRAFRIISH